MWYNNKNKYPYKDYHKEIDGQLFKKCTLHNEYFPNENEWFPATTEYFYKNNKNSVIRLNPYCKKCTKKKSSKWQNDHPEKKKQSVKKNRKTPNWIESNREKNRNQRENGYRKSWEQSENGKGSLRKSNKKRKIKDHKITKKEWFSCKEYFKDENGDWACIYCGLKAKDHYKKYRGVLRLQELHKEHVDDNGSADLDNCVPSCHMCNSLKHNFILDEWYNINNPNFEQWRYNKIIKWTTEDYKQYIEVKK